MDMHTPVAQAGRPQKIYAKRLAKLGINTLLDFIYHVPSRYEDFSMISQIASLQPGETVTIQGIIQDIKDQYLRNGKTIQKSTIADDSGFLDVTWFNQPYLTNYLKKGERISLAGKVEEFIHKPTFRSPEYEVLYQTNNLITKSIYFYY